MENLKTGIMDQRTDEVGYISMTIKNKKCTGRSRHYSWTTKVTEWQLGNGIIQGRQRTRRR